MEREPAPGRLLVATPLIGDPNFERAVIFVIEHGDDGTLGLVINNPSDIDVSETLPGWSRLSTYPAVVFVGGPVAQDRAIALAELVIDPVAAPLDGPVGDAFEPLASGVGTLDLSVDPDLVDPQNTSLRVFAGYAGWGPGQLDDELTMGAWWVIDATPDDVLCADPEHLWRRILRRQGADVRLFADFPSDPSAN